MTIIGNKVLRIGPALTEGIRQQSIALAATGQLERLVTSWCFTEKTHSVIRALPVGRSVTKRRPSPVDSRLLIRVPIADVYHSVTHWLGGGSVDASDRFHAAVDRAASCWVKPPVNMVLGREDACLSSFQKARELGITRLYDLPTAYFRTVQKLLDQELAQFPDVDPVTTDPREYASDRAERKENELALADQILCPSSFVRQSLLDAGVDASKIHCIPHAAIQEWLDIPVPEHRPPIFLFVGQISLRKGAHRLLQVWKKIKAYRTHRLRLIGPMRLTDTFLRDYAGLYEHVPSLPRHALPKEYAQARALVLNSSSEGLAMVILEAISCGTPVLASRNTGGEDILSDGIEGRFFDFGDDDALMAALDWGLSHPQELAEMGRRARLRAALWTWREYRNHFMQWIAQQGHHAHQRMRATPTIRP